MSNLKIKNTKGKSSIEEKRFYPPFELQADCPTCGTTVKFEDYLSFPAINAKEPVSFYHYDEKANNGEGAEHEWTEHIILRVTAEPA